MVIDGKKRYLETFKKRVFTDKVMVTSLFFYLFSFIITACAVMVISSRNPVHSVLFLILAFFNSGALFVILGAEFLAMMLVIVYVGAVAVLFLFVVMMLNINYSKISDGFQKYFPIGLLIGFILFVEIILMVFSGDLLVNENKNLISGIPNTHQIGTLLYTDYIFAFQLSGVILLVAMVGAIVLTLRERTGVKKQNIIDQNNRKVSDVISIVKMDNE